MSDNTRTSSSTAMLDNAASVELINMPSDLPPHLAIDSSHQHASIALCLNGEMITVHQAMPRQQSEYLLPIVRHLAEAHGTRVAALANQLRFIAVGEGPGSFVGLRLSISVAQGLSQALQVPLIPVPNLALLAWQAVHEHLRSATANTIHTMATPITCRVAIDARMSQIYSAIYAANCVEGQWRLETIEAPQLLSPSDTAHQIHARYIMVGNACEQYEALCADDAIAYYPLIPHAGEMGGYLQDQFDITALCEQYEDSIITPNYVRMRVADKS